MRVLIDLTSLDDNFSGIEHYALYITKELIKNTKIDFHLVFKNKVSCFNDAELTQKNITHHIIKGSRKKIILFDLPKYVNKYSPDYALFLAFPPSFLFKSKKEIKIITMIHDMVAFDVPKTMKLSSKMFFKAAINHAFKISYEIITNSAFSKNRILFYKKKFPNNKIHITYCGSGIAIYEKPLALLKEKYKLPDNYLLALSTLEPRKNFSNLIKYLDKIWDVDDKIAPLVVVGRKGWKVDKILKNVKHIEKITFTGFVDNEDISSIYHHSSCFIFPSIYEGFGLPILESIECGKLPICSSIEVFKELLGSDYPFYFDHNSFDQFKDCLYRYLFLKEDEKEQLLNACYKNVQNMRWDYAAKIIETLLK